MQYYKYNNLGQNEFHRVFIDQNSTLKNGPIYIGKQLFEIYSTISPEPPIGALPLNGYTIKNCKAAYPTFWDECKRREANGTIPTVNSIDDWSQLYQNQNGNVGAFYISDADNGTVKLPCFNTVVLTNITSINNINDTLGTYTSGIIGKHLHDNDVSLSIKKNNITVNQIIDTNTITDVTAKVGANRA